MSQLGKVEPDSTMLAKPANVVMGTRLAARVRKNSVAASLLVCGGQLTSLCGTKSQLSPSRVRVCPDK